MKFQLTATALAMALTMAGLHADEPLEPAPIAQDTVAAPHSKAAERAPAHSPAVQESGGTSAETAPAAKSRKAAPARKVASDYAPAQDLLLSAMSLIGLLPKNGRATGSAKLA